MGVTAVGMYSTSFLIAEPLSIEPLKVSDITDGLYQQSILPLVYLKFLQQQELHCNFLPPQYIHVNAQVILSLGVEVNSSNGPVYRE